MNSFSKVFAVLIAVLLLYLYPISAAFDQQDDISELVVLKATTTFVDAVRDKGFVSPTMYTDFMETIAATGNTFDVQMEHGSKKVRAGLRRPDKAGYVSGQLRSALRQVLQRADFACSVPK